MDAATFRAAVHDLAVKHSMPRVLEHLKDHPAAPLPAPSAFWVFLVAEEAGDYPLMEEIHRQGFDLNEKQYGRLGPPLIQVASQGQKWKLVNWLMDRDADVAWLNNGVRECPVLLDAIRYGQMGIVQRLADRDAPLQWINGVNGVTYSGVEIARRFGREDIAALIRSLGGLTDREVPGYVPSFLLEERRWKSRDNPDEMVGYSGITVRNYLLYIYHCVMKLHANTKNRRVRKFLEMLVLRAEDRCSDEDLAEARAKASSCEGIGRVFADDEFQGGGEIAEILTGADDKAMKEESARMADLLREIAGNPFRLRVERFGDDLAELAKDGIHPFRFAAEWRSETVVRLAQSIYDGDDFAAMPVLSDALESAGCDDPDILGHCRGDPGQHVRGCWVLDLVLDKDQLPGHWMHATWR